MTSDPAPSVAEGPSRREQRKEEIRRRVIDAARAIFDSQGLAETSVEEVLRRANVSRATFYSQFASKQDVARAIAGEMWERANTLYADFSALPNLSEAAVRGWLATVFDVWQREREGMSRMIADLFPLLAADSPGRHETMVGLLIGDGRHWRAFSEAEGRRRAYLLIYQLERTMQAYHLEGWVEDRDALLDTLTLAWVRMLEA
ncbi:helix-turn-helix domain-containing protein [Sphingobium aromaticivastans]|uniref:TetR/AcrR family transcriptional regulator n=1 Tax=Sphingobium aromaticivastans TaxID=1778665 RepID=UPI0030159AA3